MVSCGGSIERCEGDYRGATRQLPDLRPRTDRRNSDGDRYGLVRRLGTGDERAPPKVGKSATKVRHCGRTRISEIGGGLVRVEVRRGAVTCATARFVIRHSHPYQPGTGPSGPRGWTCFLQRRSNGTDGDVHQGKARNSRPLVLTDDRIRRSSQGVTYLNGRVVTSAPGRKLVELSRSELGVRKPHLEAST
jgi:hypothetical protein